MLAKAPNTISVPYRRARVNTPQKNTQSRLRCEARRTVGRDTRLSLGARLLYTEYDDYARLHGSAWPKQATLAGHLGVSVRSIQRWTRELQAFGYIAETRRTGRACRHRLGWVEPANVAADAPPVADHISVTEAERMEAAVPSTCPRCAGTGEREYRMGGGRDYLGRPVQVRVWRGPCGCQMEDGYGMHVV